MSHGPTDEHWWRYRCVFRHKCPEAACRFCAELWTLGQELAVVPHWWSWLAVKSCKSSAIHLLEALVLWFPAWVQCTLMFVDLMAGKWILWSKVPTWACLFQCALLEGNVTINLVQLLIAPYFGFTHEWYSIPDWKCFDTHVGYILIKSIYTNAMFYCNFCLWQICYSNAILTWNFCHVLQLHKADVYSWVTVDAGAAFQEQQW